ncbi:hypothetical protein GCM10027514_44130 [Azotobacter armeniacus]
MPLRLFLSVLLALSAMARAEELSYRRDIQPIFTAKCVACHACYDSPCQPQSGQGEGVQCGAHKLPVYNGLCTEAQETTRLFRNAEGEAAWRRKGFHSVLDADGQAALMARMLELGRSRPLERNVRLPEGLEIGIGRQNSCPQPGEFAAFARDNPQAGIRRCHPELWHYFNDLSAWQRETEPLEAGVLDVNRYQNL